MESNRRSSNSSSNNSKDNDHRKQRIADTTSEGIDYISNLPETIILCILSFLPLKEWISVSLVSKQWRYLWTKMSNLNLDEIEIINNITRKDASCPLCCEIPNRRSSKKCVQHSIRAARRKFVEFVDRTLLFHSGCTINTMKLSFLYDLGDDYTKRIDTWTRYLLTSNNIKELELNFGDGEKFRFFAEKGLLGRRGYNNLPEQYEFPHRHFAPTTLISFDLTCCKFRLSSFNVLRSLNSLYLKDLEILDGSIAEIASKCPVLEDLFLECCIIPDGFFVSKNDIMIKTLSTVHCASNGILQMDISTPNLLMLTIAGRLLTSASIHNATHLIDAHLCVNSIYPHDTDGDVLNSLLSSLNHCQSLTLSTWSIEVMPVQTILLQQLHIPLQNLKHLTVMATMSKKELPRLSCLIRSSPNLEKLTIIFCAALETFRYELPNLGYLELYNFEEETYWDFQTLPFPCLRKTLKEISINELFGKSNEIKMIIFLLKNAVVLEKLAINLCGIEKYTPYSPEEKESFKSNINQMTDFIREFIQAEVTINGGEF